MRPDVLAMLVQQAHQQGNATPALPALTQPAALINTGAGGQAPQVLPLTSPFDLAANPAGGAHVTVLKDGAFRVNAGELNPAQRLALKRALAEK